MNMDQKCEHNKSLHKSIPFMKVVVDCLPRSSLTMAQNKEGSLTASGQGTPALATGSAAERPSSGWEVWKSADLQSWLSVTLGVFLLLFWWTNTI